MQGGRRTVQDRPAAYAEFLDDAHQQGRVSQDREFVYSDRIVAIGIVRNGAVLPIAFVALRSPPTRPGRSPLAVDSDHPAASAGTLPSGRTGKHANVPLGPDRDERYVAKGLVRRPARR
jgi:hypothetical protein